MPQDYVDYVLVYKSNNKGYPGSAGNTTMPTYAQCGVAPYLNCVGFRWAKSTDRFVYGGQGSWNSQSINACAPANSSDPGPDSVGVYMHATHPYLSRLFGATLGISNRAIMQFEPLAQKVCNGLGPAKGGHP